MNNKFIWLGLSFLLVAAVLLASCSNSTTTSSPTSTSTTTTMPTLTTTTTSITAPPTTTATTTPVTGNWWDSLGTPTYGGSLVIRYTSDISCWDPYAAPGQVTVIDAYLEHLTSDIWTTNPAVFNYQLDWRPNNYLTGNLVSDFEFTTPGTWVVHVRQGVHWQDIPPANGREFVASDIVFHYDRMFGLGGMPASPYYTRYAQWQQLKSVTAPDNFTVVFTFKTSNEEFINELVETSGDENDFELPEAVAQWGNLNDWHHAIGTGPFIVTDFVDGASATLVKNPNYWAHDERYPQNQLPYIDKLQFLIISDSATALSALRTGKIDVMYGMSATQAQSIQKTNPDIVQIPILPADTTSLIPRDDKAPFNDIKVREALQMAIDLPTIAKTYYGGVTDPWPSSLTSNYLTGWGLPYTQWPQDLQAQYAYNPTQAKALLAAAGYPNGFNTDCVAANNWDPDLLQIVKSYFAAINVNMSIQVMDPAAWVSYVRLNHRADALAYGSDPLGLSYEPTVQLTRFMTGGSGNSTMVSDPVFDDFYTKALAANDLPSIMQVLKDANTYVAQQHFAISLLAAKQFALCQPWLKGYNGQVFALDTSQTAPLAAYFYCSRFWIDQNLKASMGY